MSNIRRRMPGRAAFALTIVSACAPATRTTGKITGEIVSQKNGQAVYPGFVDVLTTVNASAAGDSTGRFVLDSLPPGEHAIAGLGGMHHSDVKFIRIEPGDSVHLRFRLAPTPEAILLFPFPIPDEELLDDATRLIPTVVSSVSIRKLIAESPDSAGTPTVVWAPWARKAGRVVTADGVRLPFTADCAACIAETMWTFEGNLYSAGIDHISLGVIRSPAEGTILQFCAHLIGRGGLFRGNCESTYEAPAFARKPDGRWLPIGEKCRSFEERREDQTISDRVVCIWM